jgi:outer membrane protein OmpA-like peptidoglycan-associated protein
MLKSLFPVVAAALLLGACNQTPSPQAAAPPAQRVMAPRQMAPATVYFDTGSSTLSPQAMASIQRVAANYKTTGNATVTLTGHTDTVGSQDFNLALAQRRADAVRNALVREGVPAAAITTAAQGEASLPVQTADNVDERRNRSVDIAVAGQMARTGMSDAEYCAALSATYRDLRTSQADETAAAAMAQCQAGNTAAGIPVLERTLTNARIQLPARY